MSSPRIGFVRRACKQGDRIIVYFPNGKSVRAIAENDITSATVAVIGGKVFSSDAARPVLTATTRLFKSKTNYQDEESYPWAYLFEINDFTTYKNKQGQEIKYTDESWVYDEAEGYRRVVGDGGGAYLTESDYLQYSNDFPRNPHGYASIDVYQGMAFNKLGYSQDNFFGLYYPPVQTALSYTVSRGDGVIFPNNVSFPYNSDFFQSYGDARATAYRGSLTVEDESDREYTFVEDFFDPTYSFLWANEYDFSATNVAQVLYEVESVGNSSGELYKRCFYRIQEPGGGYFIGVHVTKDPNGVITTSNVGPAAPDGLLRDEITSDAIALFDLIDATGYVAPSWSPLTPGTTTRTLTTQEVLSNSTYVPYPDVQGVVSNSSHISFKGKTLYETIPSLEIYTGRLYLNLKSGRSPGVKDIYAQVGENKRVLLHEIPSFEPWDGYVSPIKGNTIEVVIKCGKKFHRVPGSQPVQNQFPNAQIGNYYSKTTASFFSREWSQVRVYTLSSSGNILSTSIYNNSETDLNPGINPDTISVSNDNWQKEWAGSYKDIRTPFLPTQIPILSTSFSKELNVIGETPLQRQQSITDLTTAYRAFFSETTLSSVTSLRTRSLRYLVISVASGTLTSEGFVYLNLLDDLTDRNIEPQYNAPSNVFRIFPSANYSVLSALAKETPKQSRYYVLKNATYANGAITGGISIQSSTQFPKLDLEDSGIKIPDRITGNQWNTVWKNETGVNTDLQRVAIRAIAFLGS